MITTLQQVIDDMEHGVFDYTQNGHCCGCGQCCSNFLPLSEKEIREIHRYVKKHHIAEQKHFAPTTKPTLDWTCPFLRDNEPKEKCAIYPVRPKICRIFQCNQPPSKTRENKEMFWKTHKGCDMRDVFFKKG